MENGGRALFIYVHGIEKNYGADVFWRESSVPVSLERWYDKQNSIKTCFAINFEEILIASLSCHAGKFGALRNVLREKNTVGPACGEANNFPVQPHLPP